MPETYRGVEIDAEYTGEGKAPLTQKPSKMYRVTVTFDGRSEVFEGVPGSDAMETRKDYLSIFFYLCTMALDADGMGHPSCYVKESGLPLDDAFDYDVASKDVLERLSLLIGARWHQYGSALCDEC